MHDHHHLMSTTGSIRRIPPDDIAELRGLYRVDWPKHAFTFYTLDNFFRWQKWFQNDEVQLYTDVNQDWRESGTFLVKDHNELFFDTLLVETDGMRDLLTAIIKLCGAKFSVVCSLRFRDVLAIVINDLSYGKTSDERMVCYRQSVSRNSQAERELPYGYRFGPVRQEDIDFVSHQWEYNEPMFVNLPGRLIDRNPSLGAYDLQEHLVAWCLIDQTGSLALFQTVAAHQRKGLGRAIIDRFSKQLHKDGILPQALIVDSNIPSRSLFEKLDFNVVDNWCWMRFEKQFENQTEKHITGNSGAR